MWLFDVRELKKEFKIIKGVLEEHPVLGEHDHAWQKCMTPLQKNTFEHGFASGFFLSATAGRSEVRRLVPKPTCISTTVLNARSCWSSELFLNQNYAMGMGAPINSVLTPIYTFLESYLCLKHSDNYCGKL